MIPVPVVKKLGLKVHFKEETVPTLVGVVVLEESVETEFVHETKNTDTKNERIETFLMNLL